ncbi:hypothetical protein NADFUDRAFT_52481 [Nadsonia fulvescens var. elongata DSM 6958]|uniref:Uncharacterized protein n=1 Tax=Nadsonia fulvescens var. elongata DSM 6958 TaxID=857566 RepID=A0A1E3PFI0_9ASCO|nr:hypothetical protein NADFUDRAFT_52481 [Nadsonia fulvescens var. elongata DSM 6958]
MIRQALLNPCRRVCRPALAAGRRRLTTSSAYPQMNMTPASNSDLYLYGLSASLISGTVIYILRTQQMNRQKYGRHVDDVSFGTPSREAYTDNAMALSRAPVAMDTMDPDFYEITPELLTLDTFDSILDITIPKAEKADNEPKNIPVTLSKEGENSSSNLDTGSIHETDSPVTLESKSKVDKEPNDKQ